MYRYFALYKPYGMLSQFTREGNNPSLADLDFRFPVDVYPIGRLDADSEGLLLLSNDPEVNRKVISPGTGHVRKYLIQVEGAIEKKDCDLLEQGVIIKTKGKILKTLPCKAFLVSVPENLPERVPPIRFRKHIQTSWLELELMEGKNRQVRKMTASVGYPTLRLIRIQIGGIRLGKMLPSEVVEFKRIDFWRFLNDND